MTKSLSFVGCNEVLVGSRSAHLQVAGIEADHVGDLGLALASDETILLTGRDRAAIVVTLDSDFHALLALSGASSPSVVRIRIEGMKGEVVARIIGQVIEGVESDLVAGAAVTVTERRLAVRRLPLTERSGEVK